MFAVGGFYRSPRSVFYHNAFCTPTLSLDSLLLLFLLKRILNTLACRTTAMISYLRSQTCPCALRVTLGKWVDGILPAQCRSFHQSQPDPSSCGEHGSSSELEAGFQPSSPGPNDRCVRVLAPYHFPLPSHPSSFSDALLNCVTRSL